MKTSRRTFITVLGASATTAALSGCDQAANVIATLAGLDTDRDLRPPTADEIDPVMHAINRMTWGARPGDYRRIAVMGVDKFIDEQLAPDAINDWRCDWKVSSIESMAQPTAELYEYAPNRLLADLTQYKLLRGVYSKRQLFEVMVDFWTDHFNIVSEKADCRWLKAADDRDVIRRHALGNFRDLVRQSATSAAMLIYLDGHDNKVIDDDDRPNENYARELLELHTLGVHGGYTQRDVMETARCLSGWTYENRPFRLRAARVAFNPKRHDNGAKHVLGHTIPAGGGADDLDRVIDIVCNHPSTARYIATKLCRRFVADPAPDDAVKQVADAFTQSHGDIRATLRALFQSDAFTSSRGNLFKRPLRFAISALRAIDADSDCAQPTTAYLQQMGQAPFQYPTPDGYPIEQAPWLGGLLFRWHMAVNMVAGRMKDTKVDIAKLTKQFDGRTQFAAHLIGRAPNDLERTLIEDSDAPVALMLASPAFQWH
jgi:uncharacterized protein (DUF1800 family)